VAENNTPRLMDAAGECFLYYEFRPNVHLWRIDVFAFAQLRNDEENSITTMLSFSPSKWLHPATDALRLISLSLQGDAEAFARLYACYVERMTRSVYFRVTDPQLGEQT